MEEENIEDIAFMDIAIKADGKTYIEVFDNGDLPKVIALAMVKDDNLLGIMAEAYIIYQEKMGMSQNLKTKN